MRLPATMTMMKKIKKHYTIMVGESQMLPEISEMSRLFANAGKPASQALNRNLNSSNKVST